MQGLPHPISELALDQERSVAKVVLQVNDDPSKTEPSDNYDAHPRDRIRGEAPPQPANGPGGHFVIEELARSVFRSFEVVIEGAHGGTTLPTLRDSARQTESQHRPVVVGT